MFPGGSEQIERSKLWYKYKFNEYEIQCIMEEARVINIIHDDNIHRKVERKLHLKVYTVHFLSVHVSLLNIIFKYDISVSMYIFY